MKGLCMNNFPLKIAAVIFAIFLWFYAGAAQDPLTSKSFEVPIAYENQDDSLYLSNQVATVTIMVKGRVSTISNLKADNFTAEIDLANLEPGYHELPVIITTPKGVDYANVSPNKVKTDVDELSEKYLSVQVATTGTVSEGYASATPSIQPKTVLVKGPAGLLKTVTSAQVEVNLAKTQNNLTLNLPVRLLNQNKEVITDGALSVYPLKVEVFMPINQEVSTKVVPIKALLTGNLAKGFTLAQVVTDPETIEIKGTPEALSKVDQIQTQAVTITNLAKDSVMEAELKLPLEVTVQESRKVKVTVSVIQSNITQELERPIQVRNEKSQWQATLGQTQVKCTVEGKAEDLANQEKLAALVVYVNLAGLEVGTHMVPISIENGGDLQINQVYPEAVEVTITEIPTGDGEVLPQ